MGQAEDQLKAAKERIAELEAERLAIRKLLPVKTPEGRFGNPVDDAYAHGSYYAYMAVADALGLELPHRWTAETRGNEPDELSLEPPSIDLRYRVQTDRPDWYLRSSTGVLHRRQDGPEDDGMSYHYARCGWYAELGREAIPLAVSEGARVCKRCSVIEPG